ncbi:helix-turn-helix transcriptional regulator [Sphingobium chlorophenolicum]|uniref:helix-turn-helix transcriptional regulator n=1 Tax=Sphingobium chlorophenolicum TaxID=46429 RepID=UPI00349F25A2
MTEHQPELISVREALEELRISRTTFYKLKNRADFPQPVNLLPRRTLFRRSEIWAWLENRRR